MAEFYIRNVPHEVLELWRQASTDDMRQEALRCVRIERDGENLIAVATDGHQLTYVTWRPFGEDTTDLDKVPDKTEGYGLHIPTSVLKAAVKSKRKTDPFTLGWNTVPDGGVCYVEIRNEAAGTTASAELSETLFPDWHQVEKAKLSSGKTRETEMGLDLAIIARFSTYLTKAGYASKYSGGFGRGTGGHRGVMDFYGENDPMRFKLFVRPDDGDSLMRIRSVDFIVMPCRKD